MSAAHAFRPYPETRFTSAHRWRVESAQHTPRHNRILAALPAEDYERLLPDLEPVPLPLGWTVHGAGSGENHLYFLTAGIVSRCYLMENGASAEFAVTGSEGVIGITSFLGGGGMPSQASVLAAGHAYRLRADVASRDFAHYGPLAHLLLRYTLALIAQIGQIAVCNRHHLLDRQLCYWILSCVDRLPSNELAMTHELIANMLGVRREGVSEAAARLQYAGLIHYSRGHITVLDRPGLEAHACECYAVVKREYERLFRPENTKTPPPTLARTARLAGPVPAGEYSCYPELI